MILKFLLISIVVLYAIRLLARLFLPMLFQSMVKKAQQHQNSNGQSRRPEGSVRVDYAPKNKNSVPDSEGEFVDYEEVK